MHNKETNYFVYQFEAINIQQYILTSSKLKEMVGASQLLEYLTADVLTVAITTQGFEVVCVAPKENEVVFARRVGGVFLAIFETSSNAKNFAQTWPLTVQQFMPGLAFSCASSEGVSIKQCITDIRCTLQAQKNLPIATLPETTPISQRNPQTGLPMSEGNLDLSSYAKSNFSINNAFSGWLSTNNQADCQFPVCFDHLNIGDCKEGKKFPFSGNASEHYVAIVHMDGNGIGQYIKSFIEVIGDDFIRQYRNFSQMLETISKQATQKATDWLIEEFRKDNKGQALPIRPLVLSGDDITFIIKANYAIEFVQKLALAFEEISTTELKKLSTSGTSVFPSYLTISTGLVFLRSNQPFYMGYQLAESLCDKAKEKSRANMILEEGKSIMPATLSFHLISNSQFGDADMQIQQELTTINGKLLSLLVYSIKEASGIIALDKLTALAACFGEEEEKLNISFLRKLATMLHQNPAHSKRMLSRYKEVNKNPALDNFKSHLLKLNLELDDLTDEKIPVPIADLIAIQAMEAQ